MPVGVRRIEWQGGEHDFCISPLGHVLALEEACGCGVAQVYKRLVESVWSAKDVRETIRLALIGGGQTPEKALSLVKAGEYARAGVPMLPVVAGPEETRRQILLYSWILVPATFVPHFVGVGGTAYIAAAAALGIVFLVLAHALHRAATDKAAMRLFGFSILYLFLLFAVLLGEALVARL